MTKSSEHLLAFFLLAVLFNFGRDAWSPGEIHSIYNYKSKYNKISKMSTEEYHSLTAYAIYLIVPGRESPLELKRCTKWQRASSAKVVGL